MARPLRIERPGGWYHLTARGNERRPIFRDDRDRQQFCQLLAEVVSRFHVRLHGYVLMDNHYHLILELREGNLSRAAQWLNLSYSVWFNRRHERSGHLFQGRFKSVIVSREEWGLALSRYVHLNPVRVGGFGLSKPEQQRVRKGVVEAPEAARVEERIDALRRYPWSSYPAYVGRVKRPEWLECHEILELGGGKRGRQRECYRDYVEGAVRGGLEKSPWEELKEQAVLGGQKFVEKLRTHVLGDEREQRGAKRLAVARPGFASVIEAVERVKREKWEAFRERHGDRGRDMVLYLGRKACGLKLNELAKTAGMKEYASVAMAVKRYEGHLKRNKREQMLVRQVTELLNVKM